MKKLRLTVFAVICAVCIAFGAGMMMNVNIAKADTVGTTPTLSETKVMVSKAKDKMLLATAIKDYGDVYEVGYTFNGEVTPVKNENNKFYRTISDGVNTITPADIFDVAWKNDDGVGMIIWEIEFSAGTAYGYKAYALVGDRNAQDELIVPNPVVNVENALTNKQFYTVTIAANEAEYGNLSKSEVVVPSESAIDVDENVITIGGIAVTATKNTDDAQYTYGFTGFTGTAATVTENIEITANFTRTVNEYTVLIASNNGDYGTVSAASVSNVPYGTAITVDGTTLSVGETAITATKTADTAQYTYAFTGFTGTAATVTGNMAITANFTREIRKYTITFEMGDGTAIDPMQVDYGTSVSALNSVEVTPPTGYHFVKWQLKTGESTYVDFVGNETLSENITVKAIYEINTYTVTWYDEDGETVLETDTNVEYGATPSFDGATPTKADSYAYTYAFDGWTPAVATVTGNASYTATYAGTLIPRTLIDFENAGDLEYVIGSQMTGIERVANDGTFVPEYDKGGDYLLKGTPTDVYATFSVNFGKTITAGTAIKFSLYVANTDDNIWGWFPIVVNGKDQSYAYAYWVNNSHWSASWVEYTWTLEADSDHLNICCNFWDFNRDGGNLLNISTVTVYLDNVKVMLPKSSFDFEDSGDLDYVSLGNISNAEIVANDGSLVPEYENGGDYLLKGTPTGNMAIFTFNFGQIFEAGTTIKFSLYVANTDSTVYGWFPIVVNGKNQSSGYAYWVNQGYWSAYWGEYTWTLEADADSLAVNCNFGEFCPDSGTYPVLSNITIFMDNIEVVEE